MVKLIAGCLLILMVLVIVAAQPANILGVPNTVTTTDINVSASGNTQLVAHSGTLSIYVTHYHLMASATSNVSLVYGTQTTTPCDTGTTTIDGPLPLIGQTGISAGSGLGAVVAIPSGKDLCINNGTAIQVGGAISWEYGS